MDHPKKLLTLALLGYALVTTQSHSEQASAPCTDCARTQANQKGDLAGPLPDQALKAVRAIDSSPKLPCPKQLQGLPELCELRNRYLRALASLKAKGIAAPETISAIQAPRFINLPDWKAAL